MEQPSLCTILPTPLSTDVSAAERPGFLHRPGRWAKRQRLDLRPRAQDVGTIGGNDPRPTLRLGRPFATAAAKLHTESHELWRRQSSYGYYRDHRPLRCLAQLDARAQYVNGPHPDECSH